MAGPGMERRRGRARALLAVALLIGVGVAVAAVAAIVMRVQQQRREHSPVASWRLEAPASYDQIDWVDDSHVLITEWFTSKLHLWSVDSDPPQRVRSFPSHVSKIHRELLCERDVGSGSKPPCLRVASSRTGELLHEFALEKDDQTIWWDLSGPAGLLAFNDAHGGVEVHRSQGALVHDVTLPGRGLQTPVFSVGGDLLALEDGSQHGLYRVYSVESGAIAAVVTCTAHVVGFSRNGDLVTKYNEGKTTDVITLSSERRRSFNGESVVTPDFVVLKGKDFVELHSYEPGLVDHRFPFEDGCSLDVSPSGHRLALLFRDRRVEVWAIPE